MKDKIKSKIMLLDDLVRKVSEWKREGKTIIQSHGIFDLIHPGIIKHLNEAKGQGDILIVTVIKDKDVRRGPGRPIFPEELRVENVTSLEWVDFACLVNDDNPFECVKRINPDIFARGQAYKERDRRIHEKIFEEEKEFYFGKSKIYETGGFSFSSSQIINNFLDLYPEETRIFLKNFSQKYSFSNILDKLDELKKLKVLLIGDGIIDEYHYCSSMGKSAKSPLVVHKYMAREVFAGGAFVIANHVAGLCNEVQLVTLLGREDSRENFILDNLKPNVKPKFFYREDGPTICKKRYINQYLNQKLFEIDYLNDIYINEDCELGILNYLKTTIPEYDLVLISDFGHGFITSGMIKLIESCGQRFAVNTQTNAANAGYNLITKYRKPSFVCLDETEARLTAQEKFSSIEEVAKNISRMVEADCFIITLGKKGSLGVNRGNEINHTPVFSTKVVDTVGAGDAFFAFAAPCFAQGMPLDLVSFIGNAAGALAVQIMGNKKPVEKYELTEFIHTILK